MSYIFVVMGKSASGKDSIYKELLKKECLDLKSIISYTTRPIREKEKNGVEYFFVSDKEMERMKQENKIIEQRSYNTLHGTWNYFTAADNQIDIEKNNYLVIGTLESYLKFIEYYGKEKVIPIYIQVETGIRLQRALNREKQQKEPKYAEMCRRFLADEEDFSDKKLLEADINKVYENKMFKECVKEITKNMLEYIN